MKQKISSSPSPWFAGAAGALLLLPVITTPAGLRAQALFGAGVLLLGALVSRAARDDRAGGPQNAPRSRATLFLMVLSAAVSTRYIYWRLSTTIAPQLELSPEVAFGFLLLAAELYAYLVLILGYFVAILPLGRKPVPLPADTASWPTVDIFIPTYNEPLEVVQDTVLAARALDWPADKLRVYLLDDGRRDEFRAFAARARVGYIRRADNAHAKAGNLNYALQQTSGALVAIFDCDHVPVRSFLQTTVGAMVQNPKLALLQTPHHFYSPDPFERNLGLFRRMPNEGVLFYGLLQPGNDLWDAAFFCGSCAVLRRTALEGIGGVAVDTVTEDAHTALRLHRAGWSSAYMDLPQAAGLATESLSAHVGQRIRWARGMTQIFRMDNPFLGRGLSLGQRVCYANATLHFLFGVPRIVFMVAPLAFLLFGAHIFNATPALVLAYAVPHLVLGILTNARVQGRYRRSFWAEVYEAALAFYVSIPTTLTLITPRGASFNVTAKGGLVKETYFDRRIARPALILAAAAMVGVVVGAVKLWSGAGPTDVLAINVVWCLYHLMVLGCAVGAAIEHRQLRAAPRVHARLPAMLRLESGHALRAETRDLSTGGARVEAAGALELAAGATLWLSIFDRGRERPFPATVVEASGKSLRLAFTDLGLEERGWLVAALFGRADAWIDERESAEPDRPLGELWAVARRALVTAYRLATLSQGARA